MIAQRIFNYLIGGTTEEINNKSIKLLNSQAANLPNIMIERTRVIMSTVLATFFLIGLNHFFTPQLIQYISSLVIEDKNYIQFLSTVVHNACMVSLAIAGVRNIIREVRIFTTTLHILRCQGKSNYEKAED